MNSHEQKKVLHEGGWHSIVRHYEACFAKCGVSPAGVDWPSGADLAIRFEIMLELLAHCGTRPVLLDVGCGPGLLLDYLAATGRINRVHYQGIDLSPALVDAARARWLNQSFSCRNIVDQPLPDQGVDIVIMNGVLTERKSVSIGAMTKLAQSLIAAAYRAARIGIAFNVMSAHVDWERDDLFHWRFDDLAVFLKGSVSRHFAFRADYGLFEYTCFVWRQPRDGNAKQVGDWWTR